MVGARERSRKVDKRKKVGGKNEKLGGLCGQIATEGTQTRNNRFLQGRLRARGFVKIVRVAAVSLEEEAC